MGGVVALLLCPDSIIFINCCCACIWCSIIWMIGSCFNGAVDVPGGVPCGCDCCGSLSGICLVKDSGLGAELGVGIGWGGAWGVPRSLDVAVICGSVVVPGWSSAGTYWMSDFSGMNWAVSGESHGESGVLWLVPISLGMIGGALTHYWRYRGACVGNDMDRVSAVFLIITFRYRNDAWDGILYIVTGITVAGGDQRRFRGKRVEGAGWSVSAHPGFQRYQYHQYPKALLSIEVAGGVKVYYIVNQE